jgi:hypothetical protein
VGSRARQRRRNLDPATGRESTESVDDPASDDPVSDDSTPVASTATSSPNPPNLSSRLSQVIHKGLLSSPARFVGAYDDPSIVLTHAWPALSDPTTWAAKAGNHGENSRHYFVLAFETEPQEVAAGVVVADWTWVLRRATIALSVFFGKLFDAHGLIEGGGLFHVPEMKASITPFPNFPPYNDEPRVDVSTQLNFANCVWLPRWLMCESDAMRAVNRAGKYYVRALRSFGHDVTSAYVDLVMAGEILTDRHVMTDDQLYDNDLKAVLAKLSEKDAKLIKKRLFQVRRKFSAGLRSHLNAGFFERTESKGPFGDAVRLKAIDIEKRLKAAYDVRSQYVHTGRDLGGHPHSMSDFRNELQIGRPVTDSEQLDDALAVAPTFIGLERVVRFGLLRVANRELGTLHPDLADDEAEPVANDGSQQLAHADPGDG